MIFSRIPFRAAVILEQSGIFLMVASKAPSGIFPGVFSEIPSEISSGSLFQVVPFKISSRTLSEFLVIVSFGMFSDIHSLFCDYLKQFLKKKESQKERSWRNPGSSS